MSRPQDPNRNNMGVLKANPYNNSGVLVGDRQHTVIVSGDNAAQARKYAHTLGTTSLHEALLVLVNEESTKEENEKALGDLILLRLILSGKIQFKERKFFGLVNRAITKDFKRLHVSQSSWFDIDDNIRKLIVDLRSSNKNRNKTLIILNDFTEVASTAGPGVGAIMEGFSHYMGSSMLATLAASGVLSIIGAIALLVAALHMYARVNWQDNIAAKAIVILIDEFISTNHLLLRLLLENADGESLVPTPLKRDPIGMALFFQYIKHIDTLAKDDINSKRNRNDKDLGVETMNMGSFMEHGEGETCPICTAPLIDLSDHEKAVTVCENKHKCHKDCISTWIRAKDKREEVAQCPMCNSPILPALINDVLQRGGRGTRRRRIKRRLHTRRTSSRKSMR